MTKTKTVGRTISSILSEIPSLARAYVLLTAVLAHIAVLAYLVYINMTCNSLCLGAVLYTQFAKDGLLGLLLLSAVGLVLKRLVDATYQSKHARAGDAL